MGNITIQGDLTGDVPGGEVGGASNLTTVGAIPYVSASGVLNQDPTELFWDAANNRLGVGTNAPTAIGHFKGSLPTLLIENTAANNTTIQLKTSGGLNHYIYSDQAAGNALNIATGSGTALVFSPFATERARFAATTGNLLIGTTTDSNFKLDVAASGSAGTARFYDATATTGTTKMVVRAGAGQSTNLQEWQNSGGTVLSSVAGDGTFRGAYNLPSDQGIWYSGGSNARLSLGNNGTVLWNSSATWYGGSNDLSLSRASAGVLQVGDGAANANGQVSARAVNAVSSLAAFNSTGGIYMSGNAGSSWGTIQSYSDGSGTAKATAINPTGGNVLIGTATDSNFRLDVAASGNAGTARFYGGAGVTDKTNLRIQEGGGNIQGDRLLEVVNANNTSVYFNVNPNANVSTSAVGFQTTNQRAAMVNSFGNGGGFILGDIYRLSWSSSASVVSGSYDLSLSRASASVLQVGDGGSNANGVVSLTRSQHAGVLVAALPAAAAGNAGSIQYVTDANATTIGSTVAGGGANKVMVWSDGAAWKIFAS